MVPGIDDSARVWVSANSGIGLDALTMVLAEAIGQAPTEHELVLKPCEGKLRAKLYQEADVLTESVTDLGETKLNGVSDSRLVSLIREVWKKLCPLSMMLGRWEKLWQQKIPL